MLIDIDRVRFLADNRGCDVTLVGKAVINICHQWVEEDPKYQVQTLLGREDGIWLAIDVMRTCRKASALRIPSSKRPAGLKLISSELDEDLIAQALAANGISPYLPLLPPDDKVKVHSRALDWVLTGDETDPYMNRRERYYAVVAVGDAGLADVSIGGHRERSQWNSIKHWHSCASAKFTPTEDRALEALVA